MRSLITDRLTTIYQTDGEKVRTDVFVCYNANVLLYPQLNFTFIAIFCLTKKLARIF